ncbi:MAG TPA: site-2 protease family protein, partial [Pirellulaceae bacterium]|nr:site-2 protease family protein [Pirellulaceae bacterium]
WCGVKCEKFFIGFDIGGYKISRKWGETEYGIGILPLGGYVKMLGQDDDPRNAEAEAARTRAEQPGPSDQARAEAIASGSAAEGLVTGQTVERASQQALPPNAVPAKASDGSTVLLDPRSYPARPIPARMAIISAGVIMNLIFGVILGALAYKLGINEMPAIIGGTTPGSVPWTLGIPPGSQALQIGESGQPYEHLRWEDFRFTAILNTNSEVPILFRKPNGEEEWFNVRPTKPPGSDVPLIGLAGPRDRQVNIFPEFAAHLNPAATPTLQDFDVVVEAAGQEVTSGEDLQAIFARQPLGEMKIKVERPAPEDLKKRRWEWQKSPQTIDVVLTPRPIRELGVAMKIGPVLAVRENSPAARAGILVDDQILEIDGQPLGDPLSLSQRLTPGDEPQDVTITVNRKGAGGKPERKTFTLTPEAPLQSMSLLLQSVAGANPISIEPIGVAFQVTSEVESVAAGGPAEKAGLQSGDIVTKVEWQPGVSDDLAGKLQSIVNPMVFETIDLQDKGTWPTVASRLQAVVPQTKARLTWTRKGKEMSAVLEPRDAADFVDDARGIALYPLEVEHVASDWGDAFALGFRETKDRLFQTLLILQRLVTGRLSPTNLSGPLGIIAAAGAFASQGFPDLLMFLVLLSANLAILNFLPIPALDGGHMLFLTAEAIRGRPVDEKLQVRLTVAGVVCLLSLMVFATAMDIGRIAQWMQRWFG